MTPIAQQIVCLCVCVWCGGGGGGTNVCKCAGKIFNLSLDSHVELGNMIKLDLKSLTTKSNQMIKEFQSLHVKKSKSSGH